MNPPGAEGPGGLLGAMGEDEKLQGMGAVREGAGIITVSAGN